MSCSKPKGEDYIPLSVGSMHRYVVERRGYRVDIGVMTVWVKSIEIINGKEYYKIITTYSGIPGAQTEVSYKRKTNEGIFALDLKDGHEYLEVKFPLEVNTSWTSKTSRGEIHYHVDGMWTLARIDTIYENCIRISYTGSYDKTPIEGYFYLAKGIGMVSMATKMQGFIFIYYDLVEYKR